MQFLNNDFTYSEKKDVQTQLALCEQTIVP